MTQLRISQETNTVPNPPIVSDEIDTLTPKLEAIPHMDIACSDPILLPLSIVVGASVIRNGDKYEYFLLGVILFVSTPPKRCLESALTPGTDERVHLNDTKRARDKLVRAVPSYTDPLYEQKGIDLSVLNPDDIDGVDVSGSLSAVPVLLPGRASVRPLVRRATDFPFPPPSPTHVLTPRSAASVLENVLEIPSVVSDPVSVWTRLRDDHFCCPICLKVLVRPVDVCGCGHFVCKTHVIDIYQHGGCKKGIRCSVCRKEKDVSDFNNIQIDQKIWSKILRAKFHPDKRRSVSPSRSLTPLRERFNRTFIQSDDF